MVNYYNYKLGNGSIQWIVEQNRDFIYMLKLTSKPMKMRNKACQIKYNHLLRISVGGSCSSRSTLNELDLIVKKLKILLFNSINVNKCNK